MAVSSFKTYLMYKNGGNWEKLVDIKDYPDLGSEPELLPTTTLSDPNETNIFGIQSAGSLSFTANYKKADYTTIKGMKGTETEFAVWFDATESGGVYTPSGSDGKFAFKGYIDVFTTGKGVNEVREMQLTIALTTDIVMS